jgi:hypothetical protein
MVIKVPMLAFVITVYQVSAYAVTLFLGAMLLLHAITVCNACARDRLHANSENRHEYFW